MNRLDGRQRIVLDTGIIHQLCERLGKVSLKNVTYLFDSIEQQVNHSIIFTRSLIREYAGKLRLPHKDLETKILRLARRSKTRYGCNFIIYRTSGVRRKFQKSLRRASGGVREKMEEIVNQPSDNADRDILKLVVAGEVNVVYTTDEYELARKINDIICLGRDLEIDVNVFQYLSLIHI